MRTLCLFVGVLALVSGRKIDQAEEDNEEAASAGEPEETHPDDSANDAAEEEESKMTSKQIHAVHAKIDANKDGKISLVEVMDFSKLMQHTVAKQDVHTFFEEMDTDKDGKVSLKELHADMSEWDGDDDEEKHSKAETQALETAKFKAADKDGNGQLNEAELIGLIHPETHDGVLEIGAAATLKSKDSDGDGKLSVQEFHHRDEKDKDEHPITDDEQQEFKHVDKNNDGAISLQELKAWESGQHHIEQAMAKLFATADKDGDKLVTAAELDAYFNLESGSDTDVVEHFSEWNEHIEL